MDSFLAKSFKSAFFLTLFSSLILGAVSVAFGSAALGQEISPPSVKAVPLAKNNKKVKKSDSLEKLFDQLKRTRDERLAGDISQKIWKKWFASGSASVDLLMHWAKQASGQRAFAKALDILDQVVVLRPDYAEGFNQRATLHYMMRDYKKSIADIERTLALEPRHYGALSGLADIFETLGHQKKSLETWYHVLEIYPAMKTAQISVVRLEEELAGKNI